MHGQRLWLPYPRELSRGGSPNLAALAHGFNDNGRSVIALPSVAPAVLASITVTPKITGKFKISTSVVVQNSDTGGGHRAQIFISHVGALVPDYPTIAPSPVTVDANNGTVNGASSLDLEVENGSAPYPFVAPLNVPVTFEVLGQSSDVGGVNNLSVGDQGAQITVEELPN